MAVNIASLLIKSARTFSDRPALSQGAEPYCTYGVLAERVAVLAGAFRQRFGLQPGDRLGLAMSNCPAYIEVLYAAWYAGLTAVPINAKLHRNEFAYILDHSGARLCVATPELMPTIDPLRVDVACLDTVLAAGDTDYQRLLAGEPMAMCDTAPEAVAWLFYTSGTTGQPKGAMLSHRNLLIMTLSYFADIDTISPQDCVDSCRASVARLRIVRPAACGQGGTPGDPGQRRLEAGEFLHLLPLYSGVTCFFAPTMLTRLVNHPAASEADTRHLKTIIYGGGPMYVEDLVQALELFGPKLSQIYGQGEAPMTITGLAKSFHADVDHPAVSGASGLGGYCAQ